MHGGVDDRMRCSRFAALDFVANSPSMANSPSVANSPVVANRLIVGEGLPVEGVLDHFAGGGKCCCHGFNCDKRD